MALEKLLDPKVTFGNVTIMNMLSGEKMIYMKSENILRKTH